MINGYHAHLYYDAATLKTAEEVRRLAGEKFALELGHLHQRPVGPHPRWSSQLGFGTDLFGTFVPWLMANRQGLQVFIHALTGNEMQDHTDFAMWLGESIPLHLDFFQAAQRP